jgi:tyrosyl-tRNA synthetase
MPLVTTATGVKFGKTEAGTVWLDERRTSAFRFYQFWLNTDDRDISNYLRYFTFLPEADIAAIDAELTRAPESRSAQRALATEVTRLVHGDEAVRRAERASGLLFGEGITELNVDEVLAVFEDVPSIELDAALFAGEGMPLAEILLRAGAAGSKSEAARLIRGGGVYVNNRRVGDERARLRTDEAIAGQLFVVRKGQRQNHLVRLAR